MLGKGNTSKNSKYLKAIKRVSERLPSHPRHHGIKMQAHHIISATGMAATGLGKKIEKFGYDINNLGNLSFLPCTLQGACYLGVQPHRGNHTASLEPDDSYEDDQEPPNYHRMVTKRIKALNLPLSKECPGSVATERTIVEHELNNLSKKILKLIEESPTKAPLTTIAEHFTPGNHVGCGGVDSVPRNKGDACPVGRSHMNRQGPSQKAENITYTSPGSYKLQAGK